MIAYQGEIECTYDDLVNIFGEPITRTSNPCSVEWCIEIPNGTDTPFITIIYNWRNYGPMPIGLYYWCIGGSACGSVEFVHNSIKMSKIPKI